MTLDSWITLAALTLASTASSGQVMRRTFVASNALDTYPCSITPPRRTFGTAIATTVSGGEAWRAEITLQPLTAGVR